MISLEQINQVDAAVADSIANLRASIASRPLADQKPAASGLRGVLVGRLNAIAGGTAGRHVFLETAAGIEGGSSKDLTHAQAASIMYWLGEGGDKWVPRIVEASEKARGQMPLPIEQEQEGDQPVAEEQQKGADSAVHWTGDDETVQAFWAWTVKRGLSEAQVYEALQVDDLAKYEHGKVDARYACDMLIEHIQRRELRASFELTDREHGEAAVIVFTKDDIYTPGGLCVSITARQGATAEDVAATCLALTGALEILGEFGWGTEGRVRYVPEPSASPPDLDDDEEEPEPSGPPTTTAPPIPGDEPSAQPPASSAPPQPSTTGERLLSAVKVKIGTTQSGSPQVEFYAAGHRFADLRWSFGGQALLDVSPTLVAKGWKAAHFDKVGTEYQLPCRVVWRESDKTTSAGNPYKDVVRVEVD